MSMIKCLAADQLLISNLCNRVTLAGGPNSSRLFHLSFYCQMFIFLQLIKEMLTYEDYQSKENQKKHQLGLLFQEILK